MTMVGRGFRASAFALAGAGVAALCTLAFVGPGLGKTTAPVAARSDATTASAPAGTGALALPTRPSPAPRYVDVANAAELDAIFAAVGYSLEAVRQGDAAVPRLLVADLPADFNAGKGIDARKTAFLRIALPLILDTNERLLVSRRALDRLVAKRRTGSALSGTEKRWLRRLAERFETAPDNLAELQLRVDAVSPAVALAQAAEESGWGRSRFARSGNALFGQRTWTRGAGMVPKRRRDGAGFEVKAFTSLADSALAYAMNLNTHPAYDDYRRLRAAARAAGRTPDAAALADTLTRYAERADDYVTTIRAILRVNDLGPFDGARLSRVTPTVQVARRPDRQDMPRTSPPR